MMVFLCLDREICKKWISRLCNLKSAEPNVKKYRNFFFRYMLNVLRKDLDQRQDPFGYPQYDDRVVVNLKETISVVIFILIFNFRHRENRNWEKKVS